MEFSLAPESIPVLILHEEGNSILRLHVWRQSGDILHFRFELDVDPQLFVVVPNIPHEVIGLWGQNKFYLEEKEEGI